jgi:hypothetical protein
MSAAIWPLVTGFLHGQLEFIRATHEICCISDEILPGDASWPLPHPRVIFFKIFIMEKNPINHRFPQMSLPSIRLHRSRQAM